MPYKHWRYPLLLLFTITLSLPLFFHKLGASSLASWDEAWYAAVAKNILITGNPVNLKFNGQPFADHPPAGFWLMAASMKAFGENEFAARLPSAVCGIFTLIIVFLLGTEVSSPAVGLASVIALISFPWFISRARSGNLDIPLTFFFIATFYLALKASRNRRYLIPFGISLGLLLLTKTLIPFAVIPSLLVIFYKSPVLHTKKFFISFCSGAVLFGIWFLSQLLYFPGFIGKYLTIGLPPTQVKLSFWQILNQTKSYIHYGIGAWFRPLVLLLPSLLLLKKSPHTKYLISAVLFIFVFLTPFAFSSRTQIWHLVPAFPFLILVSLSGLSLLTGLIFRTSATGPAIILTLTLLISVPQISRNWREFVDIPAYISDEAILSREASLYPYPMIIDDKFLPVAAYYSGKNVYSGSASDIRAYFISSGPLLLITHQWRLDQDPALKSRYQIIKTDRDMALLLINPE